MNQTPYFSIIIPTLNEEQFLPKLLSDLKRQTFTDFEVIVVDGNSTDKTVALAKKATSLNLQVINSKKRNVSHQRNLGVKHAHSNWVIFFDADNRLPTYFLEGIKYQLHKKSTDAFSTFIHPDSNIPGDKAIATIVNYGTQAVIALNKPTAMGACIGIKKDIFNKVGQFNPKVPYQEDTELVRRVHKSGYKFIIFSEPAITYSFRRFRKEGTLNFLRRASLLLLKNNLVGFTSLTNLANYPMLGGEYYQTDTQDPNLLDLKQLSLKLKKLTSKQKQKLDSLLNNFTH